VKHILLVKTLHEEGLMSVLKENVESGKAYLGCSAGSNIGGQNMKTTNDMPIVYPQALIVWDWFRSISTLIIWTRIRI
jgi:peptidase E